jgi:hypothetical protein
MTPTSALLRPKPSVQASPKDELGKGPGVAPQTEGTREGAWPIEKTIEGLLGLPWWKWIALVLIGTGVLILSILGGMALYDAIKASPVSSAPAVTHMESGQTVPPTATPAPYHDDVSDASAVAALKREIAKRKASHDVPRMERRKSQNKHAGGINIHGDQGIVSTGSGSVTVTMYKGPVYHNAGIGTKPDRRIKIKRIVVPDPSCAHLPVYETFETLNPGEVLEIVKEHKWGLRVESERQNAVNRTVDGHNIDTLLAAGKSDIGQVYRFEIMPGEPPVRLKIISTRP